MTPHCDAQPIEMADLPPPVPSEPLNLEAALAAFVADVVAEFGRPKGCVLPFTTPECSAFNAWGRRR